MNRTSTFWTERRAKALVEALSDVMPDSGSASAWMRAVGLFPGPLLDTAVEGTAHDPWAPLHTTPNFPADEVLDAALSRFPYANQLVQLATDRKAATFSDRQLSVLLVSAAAIGPERDFVDTLTQQVSREGFLPSNLELPQLGLKWANELHRSIAHCDAIVLMLSERGVRSELLLAVMREARRRQTRECWPLTVPIRFGDAVPLPYELHHYLGEQAQLYWNSPTDSDQVARGVMGVLRADERAFEPAKPATRKVSRASAEKSPLRLSLGPVAADHTVYIRRESEQLLESLPTRGGETISVVAPPEHGKTSALLRVVARTRESGHRAAHIDFSVFRGADLEDHHSFLLSVASVIGRQLEHPLLVQRNALTPDEFQDFMETAVGHSEKRCVLVFDSVDRLMGRAFQTDFFAQIRAWHNERARPNTPWQRVDLVLSTSTEPTLLVEGSQSPFNVGKFVGLEPFEARECAALNERYGTSLSSRELTMLNGLLGGHPLLTQIALFSLRDRTVETVDELLKTAIQPSSPFSDHLRGLLFRISVNPHLIESSRRALRAQSLDRDAVAHLRSAGLLVNVGSRQRIANRLYEQFLEKVLARRWFSFG